MCVEYALVHVELLLVGWVITADLSKSKGVVSKGICGVGYLTDKDDLQRARSARWGSVWSVLGFDYCIPLLSSPF